VTPILTLIVTRKAVVFDVGGVIVQWQPLQLMREHLPTVSPEEAHAQVFQSWAPGADWLEFDRGTVAPDALADRIARRTGYPRSNIESLIGAIGAHLKPMPDSVALLARVRAAGHALGLLSNMPQLYADDLETAHECFGWFDHRAWSGRVGLVKPDRAFFDHVLTQLEVELSQAVFIDDSIGHVEAARRYGWSAVHFQSAAQAEQDLRALHFL
jgi:putative hydrolase of the HAD superfamily